MKAPQQAHNRERNTEESQVGKAHHALRAYVKAYSTRADGQAHSFKIAADRKSAAILNAAGEPVLSLSIEELAAQGSAVRFALAGLRDVKETLENAFAASGERRRVRYNLDVIARTVDFTIDGKAPSAQELADAIGPAYRTLTGADPVAAVITAGNESDLATIDGWAKIGSPISTLLFGDLESAEEYGLKDHAEKQRERAYRLGLIRRPASPAAPAA